jgi:hypothetical protein
MPCATTASVIWSEDNHTPIYTVTHCFMRTAAGYCSERELNSPTKTALWDERQCNAQYEQE